MRFGSVCSGIEAASVAWAPLGWKAAWFSEIEPFPCEVLKHHFPDVTNMGDMTLLPERIASGEVEPPDMLCGGTPCQAFSYAGKRRSLDDYRGNLSLTFCDIADSIDHVRTICGDEPCIVFWENVPGVLSTKDNAFGCFLGQLVGADAPLSSGSTRWPCAGVVVGPKRKAAWRVLDAQHFGVPQRRRRVFVVASARERVDPAEILFERKGVCGDSEKGGSQRQDAAAFTLGSFAQYREGVGTLKAQGGDIGGGSETIVVEPSVYDMTHACDVIRESELSPTLQARMGTGGNQIPLVLGDKERIYNSHLSYGVVKEETVCKTLNAQMDNQTDMPLVLSENGSDRTACAGITPPLKTTTPCYCLAENTIGRKPQNGGNGAGYQEGLSYTLNATGVHGVLAPCYRLNDQGGERIDVGLDRAHALRVETHGHEQIVVHTPNSTGVHEVCYPIDTMNITERGDGSNGMGIGADGDPSYTLSRGHHHGVATPEQVRRLTPVECERLQGFPDNWTQIPYRGKTKENCPDAPRYKAIGNSWAVPVVRWIGNRIKENLK